MKDNNNFFIESSLLPYSDEVLEIIDEDSATGKRSETDIAFAVEKPKGGVTVSYYTKQEIKKVYGSGEELGEVFADMSEQKVYGFRYE